MLIYSQNKGMTKFIGTKLHILRLSIVTFRQVVNLSIDQNLKRYFAKVSNNLMQFDQLAFFLDS